MATKKKASGGAKKSAKKGVKKGGAKKGAPKKAAAKKSAGPGKCSGWKAIHDFMPPGPPVLRVTGKCVFPTPGYKVRLVKAVPQGFNPRILLLRKVVTPPTGMVLQVLSTVQVRYELKTSTRYTHVSIITDGVTIKVQTVT